MGLFSPNATELDVEEAAADVAPLLVDGEQVVAAFLLIRDRLIFTECRFIFKDVQGLTGSKISHKSVPYSSVNSFSVETAGSFDLEAELTIWIKGQSEPMEVNLSRQIDTSKVSRLLAKHVL